MMQAFYFSKEERQLFGVYYEPGVKAPTRNKAILICPPGIQESMRMHWAFRNLAATLSRQGYPVMKFDYFGSGDSSGDTGDGNLEEWKNNIVSAAQELLWKSKVTGISLIGIRLGAALASMASYDLKEDAIQDLVLWDPVVHGERYLNELGGIQELIFKKNRYGMRYAQDAERPELLGYPLNQEFVKSIRAFSLLDWPFFIGRSLALITSEQREEYDSLRVRLQRSGQRFKHYNIPDVGHWRTNDLVEQALLPGKIIAAIPKILEDPT